MYLPPEERVPGRENREPHAQSQQARITRLNVTALMCDNQVKRLWRDVEQPLRDDDLWMQQSDGCGARVDCYEQFRSRDRCSPPAPAASLPVPPSANENGGRGTRAYEPGDFDKSVEPCRVGHAKLKRP
jgi:hypothetical protein